MPELQQGGVRGQICEQPVASSSTSGTDELRATRPVSALMPSCKYERGDGYIRRRWTSIVKSFCRCGLHAKRPVQLIPGFG